MSMNRFGKYTGLGLVAVIGVLTAPRMADAQVPSTPGGGVAGAAPGCVPACRSGFVCNQGQCISMCNPPCAAGDLCTANGECVRGSPPSPDAPPPVTPAQPVSMSSNGYADAAQPSDTGPRRAENALYVELLGPGLLYSVDYDRAFGDLSARIGIGYLSGTSSSFVAVPLTISYLGLGSKKHMFEIGAGVAIWNFSANYSLLGANSNSSTSATIVAATGILGYRYQPPNGGFFLRVGLSPLIFQSGFIPWPHLGLGATF